ncbi:MAG: dihydroorotase [Candidatus Omnitrophota bacterium]
MQLLIKNGKIINPKSRNAKTGRSVDILIENNKIKKIDSSINISPAGNLEIFDAKDLMVIPGLIDMHVHLREPGFEYKETIFSGSQAAVAGGFTSVCPMPNTNPVIDNEACVEFLLKQNKKANLINLFPVGAITKNSQGEHLSDMSDMKDAGVIAFSDDGKSVMNSEVMRRSMEYAQMLDLLIISHCEDILLAGNGVMNEGQMSTKLGLKGIPRIAEINMVARDIEIARYTQVKLHIAHISCAESVELVRCAKKSGVKVTAECTPHHFSLTEDAVDDYDTNTKVNPPLRTLADIKAIIQGLKDGTIDCIATDHAPHADSEKDLDYDHAPFGIIGLETAFGLGMTNLVIPGHLSLAELIEKMSYNPACILKLEHKGKIEAGFDADITIVDPETKWIVNSANFFSKSKNSPFIGKELAGRIKATIVGGKKVFEL